MSENINTTAEGGNTLTGEKTFTQDDVNRIVQDRLAKEKAKLDASLVEREQALQQREMAVKAQELLAERGLPKTLATALRYSNEDELVAALDSLQALRGFTEEKPKAGIKRIFENKLPDDTLDRDMGSDLDRAFGLTSERYD